MQSVTLRLTHDSESQGQEEAGLCDERVSSFSCKLTNALNKPQ